MRFVAYKVCNPKDESLTRGNVDSPLQMVKIPTRSSSPRANPWVFLLVLRTSKWRIGRRKTTFNTKRDSPLLAEPAQIPLRVGYLPQFLELLSTSEESRRIKHHSIGSSRDEKNIGDATNRTPTRSYVDISSNISAVVYNFVHNSVPRLWRGAQV